MHLYSQVVLPLERLAAHRAHVFPLIAVRQLVLRERRCVVEHLPADLQTETVQRVSASLCRCLVPDSRLNWLFMLSSSSFWLGALFSVPLPRLRRSAGAMRASARSRRRWVRDREISGESGSRILWIGHGRHFGSLSWNWCNYFSFFYFGNIRG